MHRWLNNWSVMIAPSDGRGQARTFILTRQFIRWGLGGGLALAMLTLGIGGWGIHQMNRLDQSYEASSTLVAEIERARIRIAELDHKLSAEQGQHHAIVESLAREVGQAQARLARMESFGSRLVDVAGLEEGEFDFSTEPAVGGPNLPSINTTDSLASALPSALNDLLTRTQAVSEQIDLLGTFLEVDQLRQSTQPGRWPTDGGYVSSPFGHRISPFDGSDGYHFGVDIANHLGASVRASADGIVTYAGPRYGYGFLVEIDHGGGLKTRYGHNSKILVKVGQRVAAGEQIAAVGSTGHSTGPHIHFEVLHGGRAVNPMPYLRQAKN